MEGVTDRPTDRVSDLPKMYSSATGHRPVAELKITLACPILILLVPALQSSQVSQKLATFVFDQKNESQNQDSGDHFVSLQKLITRF